MINLTAQTQSGYLSHFFYLFMFLFYLALLNIFFSFYNFVFISIFFSKKHKNYYYLFMSFILICVYVFVNHNIFSSFFYQCIYLAYLFLLCLHTYLFIFYHSWFIYRLHFSEVLRIRGNLISFRMFIFRKTLACIQGPCKLCNKICTDTHTDTITHLFIYFTALYRYRNQGPKMNQGQNQVKKWTLIIFLKSNYQ